MAPDDLPPRGDLAAPGTAPDAAAPAGPRQTLAMRLAARNRQRELRAERLARLRPPAGAEPGAGPAPESAATPAAIDAAETALEDFLRTLTGDLPPLPEGPPVEPGALLPFQRPAEPAATTAATTAAMIATMTAVRPAGDLDRLPGVGPGLIWALERAGFERLADLAPLAPSELAARLGPLGRLVPAERWIAAAREAEG
jgi:hypothetical protein